MDKIKKPTNILGLPSANIVILGIIIFQKLSKNRNIQNLTLSSSLQSQAILLLMSKEEMTLLHMGNRSKGSIAVYSRLINLRNKHLSLKRDEYNLQKGKSYEIQN